MVEKLNSVNKCICSKRYGPITYGKALFPIISVNADLSAFVGEDSWSIFHLLKLDTSFLYRYAFLDTSFLDIPVAECPS